ncbi:MAG: V-type ATPase subunit [Candidatus Caldatribacteriaceae bacterium]
MTLQVNRSALKEDMNFAYLVGRVRALESSILIPRVLENVLKAEDLEQALRIVSEIPYWGTTFQSIFRNPQALDEVLISHYWGFLEDFRQYKIASSLVSFFTLGFDFAFLKLAMKHHLAKKPLKKSYPTTLDEKRVFRFFSGESGEFLLEPFARAVREAFSVWETQAGQVQLLEFVLDRFYLQEVYQLALGSESQAIKNWLLAYVVFSLLKIVLRARCQEKKPEVIRLMYVPNAFMPQDVFLTLLSVPSDKVPEMIADLGFRFLLGNESFRDDPYSVAEIEKNIDNYLVRFARTFRVQTFGPEPVFGFLFAKSMDAKNLRIVLEGKYFGLPMEVLRAKVRECYYE